MQTTDLGRLYLTAMTYPDGATRPHVAETSWAVETEPPYRFGRGIAVRLPFSRRALIVGWWGREAHDEDTALNRAVNGLSGPEHHQWWDASGWWDEDAEA